VESLLIALEHAPDFLEEPVCGSLSEAETRDEVTRSVEDGESLAGERVGAWELIEKIADGGMGSVYKARRADGHYEKMVAIKLIRRSSDADHTAEQDKMVRRFREELQYHANLDHPNVAKFFDGGTTPEGLPYLVMEYIEGQPITKHCEAAGLSVNERLKLFHTVCLAVQHAHSLFVAHCDIKPSNILVIADSEPDGEAVPKLLDFGIARLLKQDGDKGKPQAIATTRIRPMTPEYASPEQVQGAPITAASDVYALGVVLYELVTGQLPYKVTDYDAKQVVCERIPRRPSLLKRTLNREINAIVLKALEKKPAHRYPSAAAFAEDIDLYLNGRPIGTRVDTPLYRFRKFISRYQLLTAVVLALIALGIAGGVWIGEASREAERQTAEADRGTVMSLLDSMGRRSHLEAISFEEQRLQREAEGLQLEADSFKREAEKKFTDAAACFNTILAMTRNAPGGSEPRSESRIAEPKRLLGHCLLKLGRYQQAEDLLLESYSATRARLGDADARTEETRRWIIELYNDWGKADKSEEWRIVNGE